MSDLPLVLIGGWGVPVEAVATVASRWPGRVMTVSVHDYAEAHGPEAWVRQLLSRAPVSAVWAGWSLGGQLAMLAAQIAPARVAGVWTVCSSPRFLARPDWPGMSLEEFAQFRVGVAAKPARAWKRFLLLQIRGDEYEAEGRKAWQPWLKEGPAWPRETLLAGLDWLGDLDRRAGWRDCQVPHSHWFGDQDPLVDPALVRTGSVANARLAAGMAHWPFGAHADALAVSLRQFGRTLEMTGENLEAP